MRFFRTYGTREAALRYGWSGEHDGCPLHGHATDMSKATEGCTCQRHLDAKVLEGRLKETEEAFDQRSREVNDLVEKVEELEGQLAKVEAKKAEINEAGIKMLEHCDVLEGRAAKAIPLFEEAVRTGDIEKAGLAIRALRGEG